MTAPAPREESRPVESKAFDAGFLAGCAYGMDACTPVGEKFTPSPDRDEAWQKYKEAAK